MYKLLTLNYSRTVNRTLFEIGHLATGFFSLLALAVFLLTEKEVYQPLNNTYILVLFTIHVSSHTCSHYILCINMFYFTF